MKNAVSLAEIQRILSENNAFLIHFSGPPGGLPADQIYPFDLRYVISTQHDVCCSTIGPNDNEQNTLSGHLGLILAPTDFAAVKAAGAHDLGSCKVGITREVEACYCQISSERLQASIKDRSSTDYNEWILGRYAVIGLFTLGDTFMANHLNTRLARLRSDFPAMKIITQLQGSFVEVTADGAFAKITASEIYDCRNGD